MTLKEVAEKILKHADEEPNNLAFIVKFCNGEWDGGFTDQVVLPIEKRDELVQEYGCDLEGYMTLTDFHLEELTELGADEFAKQYKTALEVAMKSRITMHKRPG